MGDHNRLVEVTGWEACGSDVMGTSTKRMDNFKMWGRGAQLLLLEFGGYWDRLNEWMKDAIGAKDGGLIKELLNLILNMPTCSSQLMENQMGLPVTVQDLLKKVARPPSGEQLELPEFGSHEEREAIKSLCCEIYVKWLKIKKHSIQEGDDWKIGLTTQAGERGVVAKIEGMTDCVLLAINGQVSLMKIEWRIGSST